jgi:hypothetical protein
LFGISGRRIRAEKRLRKTGEEIRALKHSLEFAEQRRTILVVFHGKKESEKELVDVNQSISNLESKLKLLEEQRDILVRFLGKPLKQ